jgi:hypothetical protein
MESMSHLHPGVVDGSAWTPEAEISSSVGLISGKSHTRKPVITAQVPDLYAQIGHWVAHLLFVVVLVAYSLSFREFENKIFCLRPTEGKSS